MNLLHPSLHTFHTFHTCLLGVRTDQAGVPDAMTPIPCCLPAVVVVGYDVSDTGPLKQLVCEKICDCDYGHHYILPRVHPKTRDSSDNLTPVTLVWVMNCGAVCRLCHCYHPSKHAALVVAEIGRAALLNQLPRG